MAKHVKRRTIAAVAMWAMAVGCLAMSPTDDTRDHIDDQYFLGFVAGLLFAGGFIVWVSRRDKVENNEPVWEDNTGRPANVQAVYDASTWTGRKSAPAFQQRGTT